MLRNAIKVGLLFSAVLTAPVLLMFFGIDIVVWEWGFAQEMLPTNAMLRGAAILGFVLGFLVYFLVELEKWKQS